MNSYLRFLDNYKLLSLGLALILTLSMVTATVNLTKISSDSTTATNILTDHAAISAVGSGPGGCGIAVGIVGGVVGLALGGVTLGFGTALAISASLHVAAIACVS